jgi:hypothetical protein
MITYTVKVNDDGSKHWYINGKLHREDGPACEYANGDKCWYSNDKRHREDGPAVEYANGSKYWYINGKAHREDGPAIECADGTKEWYIDDIRLTEEQFNARKNVCCEGKTVQIDGVKYRLTKV